MTTIKQSIIAAVSAGLALLTTTACATNEPALDDEVQDLIRRSAAANAALMRGDIDSYGKFVRFADDFTLMSPFGGQPTKGAPSGERMEAIGKFFKNGSLQQELVQSYRSPDMVVLAVIERAHVEVGGLPAQDWALRVTLVYRRDGDAWRLAHRHADPLVGPVSLPQAAALSRGDRVQGG